MAITGALLLGLVTIAVLAWYFLHTRHTTTGITTKDRRPDLKKLVEEQERVSAEAAASYTPKMVTRLEDLATSAEPVLKQLPGVVSVEVAVPAEKVRHRIVHLRDWHFVPKGLYALELGVSANGEEVDRRHEEHCLEVEAVQLEQMALLRCLIKHHGLQRIFLEGLTKKDLSDYRERVAALRSMEKDQIPELRKQLADVHQLKKSKEAATIEEEVMTLLQQHQQSLLELGAPGRLLVAGDIKEVLPLDDADFLDKAKPITPAGKIRADARQEAAREDAMVKAATKQPFALIVLGGSHDLSDSVRRIAGGQCEYIRVTTRRVRQFADGEEK